MDILEDATYMDTCCQTFCFTPSLLRGNPVFCNWLVFRVRDRIIELVKRGGTIERINGQIVSQDDAEILIKEIKGTILRAEGGHIDGINPHKFPHINYITQDGRKGTIRIQEVIREIGTGKF